MLQDAETVTRDYVFGEKNWHDFSDRCRYVRDERYKYIRNFYPHYANTPSADALRSPVFRTMQRLQKDAAERCVIRTAVAGPLQPQSRRMSDWLITQFSMLPRGTHRQRGAHHFTVALAMSKKNDLQKPTKSC